MKSHLTLVSTVDMTRELWLNYRHSGLGASEIGAIMGLDDYTSSLELFYYKAGEAPKFDVESMASFMGREQEDLVARMWQHWDGDPESLIRNFRDGVLVRKCQRVNAFVRNPRFPWLYCSLDRKINKHLDKDEGNLEIKTIAGWEADKWAGGIPPKYVTQVQSQMLVCEFLYGEMAILQDGRLFSVEEFEPSATIQNAVVEKTRVFWDRVLQARKLVNEKYNHIINMNQRGVDKCLAAIDALAPEPDGSLAYESYLRQRHNDPRNAMRRGSMDELQLAQDHLRLSEQLKEMQTAKQQVENSLKVALADHQMLDFGRDGKVYWSKTEGGRRHFRNRVQLCE